MSDALRTIERVLDDAVALHRRVRGESLDAVAQAAEAIAETYRAGGKVLVFGKGGGAADAQHFAAELVGRFERDRARWPRSTSTCRTRRRAACRRCT
jgi:phosphoheptose isomerase